MQKRIVLPALFLIISSICWGQEKIRLPIKMPAYYELPPMQPKLQEHGLVLILNIKSVYDDGTIKEAGIGIAYPNNSSDEAKALSRDPKMNMSEMALFVTQFNWAVAQTKADPEKRKIEGNLIKAFVGQIKAGDFSRRLADYLPVAIRTKVQAELTTKPIPIEA